MDGLARRLRVCKPQQTLRLFLDAGLWMAYCTKDSECDSGNCTMPQNGSSTCVWCEGCPQQERFGPGCTTNSDCDSFTDSLRSAGLIEAGGIPAHCSPASDRCDLIWTCRCNAFKKMIGLSDRAGREAPGCQKIRPGCLRLAMPAKISEGAVPRLQTGDPT